MWDDHAWVVPHLKAALDAKVPPSAILLGDPAHKEYDAWDLKLIAAYHVYRGLLNGSVPIYWDESDRVTFDAKTGVSKSQAAIDRKQDQDRKAAEKSPTSLYGKYYYAVPRVIDGGALPTLEEWLAEKAAKKGRETGGPKSR